VAVIRSTFEWAGELYGRWFADWLHVHFLIRTVLIIFMLWLIIYLSAQLIKYIFAPLALMFFIHVIFRAWNFLFIETPHEWIYIKYHSKDIPKFSELYLRLCDKVKHNRMILSHTKYKGALLRSRKFAMQFMIICSVAATLWVSAFGLHQEYSAPSASVYVEERETDIRDNETESEDSFVEIPSQQPQEETPIQNAPFEMSDNAILTLNESGSTGARLHSGPGITGETILEILWDDATLLYLNENVPDEYVNGLFWLRVQSPDGTVGYISSQLVEIE
jgi:hypothetical protein